MGASFSNLTDAACAVHQFKINGYSATKSMDRTGSLPSNRLAVGGYEWEVHYTPSLLVDGVYWIAFKLVLLGAPRRADGVKAAFRCRLLYPSFSDARSGRTPGACVRDAIGNVEGQVSHAFKRAGESSGWVPMRKRSSVEAATGVIENDSFTAECAITVVTEPPHPDAARASALPPSPVSPLLDKHSLRHDLGELLGKGTGTDVELAVSGESFAAHKAILAARSPVFMAQFFGPMKDTHSKRVEVEDMEAAVFGAMLRFIYTDRVPELERQDDGAAIVAQHPLAAADRYGLDRLKSHLLAAADRYGLDRLKSMCEYKLCDGTTVETAATTLALAEQHGCSKLKARCVEFIAANLDAVMATEGYKHLMTSSPLVMNDLLRAVRAAKN